MLKPNDIKRERLRIDCELEELEIEGFKNLVESLRSLDEVREIARQLRCIAARPTRDRCDPVGKAAFLFMQ
jgi:hypothetical protein